MFVIILVEFDIFRLQIDNSFAVFFRVISFAFFDAMLDENWVDFLFCEIYFFDTKSIFSIESSKFLNAFNVALVQFKLKIPFVDI